MGYEESSHNNIDDNKEDIKDNSSSFHEFWKAYPRKEAKGNAEKAWKKIDISLLSVILEAIERQKATTQWQEANGKFIPLPASWLNARRWEDEIESPAALPESNDVPEGLMNGRRVMNNVFVRCMVYEWVCPIKHYELAIIDPPYRDTNQPTKDMRANGSMFSLEGRPSKGYWKELYRISKEQIIWGANNFQLPTSVYGKGFVVWKKKINNTEFTMSMV